MFLNERLWSEWSVWKFVGVFGKVHECKSMYVLTYTQKHSNTFLNTQIHSKNSNTLKYTHNINIHMS
jgi:hypothetical protein